jgi:hypothetical protein
MAYLTWSLESQTNGLVVAIALLQLFADAQSLPFSVLEDCWLTLIGTLGLIRHDFTLGVKT